MSSISVCAIDRPPVHIGSDDAARSDSVAPMSNDNPMFDEQNAARYNDRWAKLAPFAKSVHLLAGSALRSLGDDAHVLCVGAGTGAELGALAQQFPTWRFLAVDPAEAMLRRARQEMERIGVAERCEFFTGTLDQAPMTAPFDACTSILVSHFLVDRAARVEFFREMRRRLKRGGVLVTADLAASSIEGTLGDIWNGLLEHVGLTPDEIAVYREQLGKTVSIVPVHELEALVAEGGFEGIERVFQACWIGAWVARAR